MFIFNKQHWFIENYHVVAGLLKWFNDDCADVYTYSILMREMNGFASFSSLRQATTTSKDFVEMLLYSSDSITDDSVLN